MTDNERIRLDKWLWAARFFRTRAKAKDAIVGGKVHCNGQRAKPAREIGIGDALQIRQGFDERSVIVQALAAQRGDATAAQALYEETAESIAAREAEAVRRRARRDAVLLPDHRPDRRDRRTLEDIKKRGGL
ncbi:MAG: S4 domain-containing protein [Pseudomonadales bacterium]|nr:S4 domain-containing protein [Pseudomonadales bacterium]